MFTQRQAYDPNIIEHQAVDESAINRYVAKVFGWMFIGLLITAITTVGIIYGINVSEAFSAFISTAFEFVLIVFLFQVVLVGVISARVTAMNPLTAKILFVVYAMTNGLTVGLVAVLFAQQIGGMYIIGMAFGITAAAFGIMAIYGMVTQRDLTSFSSLLRMGLIGLIIAMLINFFFGSSMMDFLICIIGLLIFLGLTAADTNKIKHQFAVLAIRGDQQSEATGVAFDQDALASNLAIMGALMLYLDFINMFMFILRIFGRRR